MKYAALFCVGVLLLAGCAAPVEETGPDPAEVRQAIEANNARFAEVMNSGDASGIGDYYTDDAIYMPSMAPSVRGPQATEEALAATVSMLQPSGFELTTSEVEVHGDTAIEVGRFSMNATLPGQDQPMQTQGKYIVIWKQQEDGTWKLHRDIWNHDMNPFDMGGEDEDGEEDEQ